MLEGTGCRLAEIAGLLVADVKHDHENPHVDLVFHPHRLLKNKGSTRKVPLVGDALPAVREAVDSVGGSFLFAQYVETTLGPLEGSPFILITVQPLDQLVGLLFG